MWLVDFARHILVYGPLKSKADFVAKLFHEVSTSVPNYTLN